jgi:lipoprotein-anchoring transpeptidase ErfK/SrfK
MRCAAILIFLCASLLGHAQDAQANVLIEVDRTEQIMRVYEQGELIYVWPVSTGKRGYTTPTGSYQPYSLRRFHRSQKYYNSPMPFSIFYRGGYAIHGTSAINRLGRRASHGCIRLHTANARELFHLVSEYGKEATEIVIYR